MVCIFPRREIKFQGPKCGRSTPDELETGENELEIGEKMYFIKRSKLETGENELETGENELETGEKMYFIKRSNKVIFSS